MRPALHALCAGGALVARGLSRPRGGARRGCAGVSVRCTGCSRGVRCAALQLPSLASLRSLGIAVTVLSDNARGAAPCLPVALACLSEMTSLTSRGGGPDLPDAPCPRHARVSRIWTHAYAGFDAVARAFASLTSSLCTLELAGWHCEPGCAALACWTALFAALPPLRLLDTMRVRGSYPAATRSRSSIAGPSHGRAPAPACSAHVLVVLCGCEALQDDGRAVGTVGEFGASRRFANALSALTGLTSLTLSNLGHRVTVRHCVTVRHRCRKPQALTNLVRLHVACSLLRRAGSAAAAHGGAAGEGSHSATVAPMTHLQELFVCGVAASASDLFELLCDAVPALPRLRSLNLSVHRAVVLGLGARPGHMHAAGVADKGGQAPAAVHCDHGDRVG